MKSKRYTEEQIIGFLKAHESGAKVTDLVRQHGFSEQSFYRWKSKFGGCTSSDLMGPIDPFSKRHFSASCFSSLDC
jgi:hypothetical protein